MQKSHAVIFQPEGRRETVLSGTTLLEAASRAGLVLEAPCGGHGSCGKCRVRIESGNAGEPRAADQEAFAPDELEAGWRLACCHKVEQDLTVTVPSDSRLYEQKILMEGVGREVALEPNILKTFVQLDKPSVEDQRADLDRLSDALYPGGRRLRPSLALARRIPDKLRRNDFAVTLVTEGGELIAVESGDSRERHYGVAFDLGTTTIVGVLIDLNTGAQLGAAARGNPQAAHGDDVVSRIQKAVEDPQALDKLHHLAVDCINEIVDELCRTAGIEHKFIYELTVAGNTAMTHFLLGLPPNSLAAAPYVGALRQSFSTRAEPMGFHANHHARLYTMPNIAGFVGGDTTAVILSSGMHEADELTLAVDIGTNGEIVLGDRRRLVTCSTAAGPAFEGARIRQGMRATTGAIDKVIVDEDVRINVLGGAKARGLCGTGLIDAVAQLIEAGIIDSGGRIQSAEALGDSVPEALRRRIEPAKGGQRFMLALPEESETGLGVALNQGDVRELQLAKGAIMSGILLLARELGVQIDDVRHVLLAGAFGNYINPRSAKVIGLIPDLPEERLQYIGNAASAGARMTLVSASYRQLACDISLQTEYVEMAARPDFQEEFMMQMMFLPPAGV